MSALRGFGFTYDMASGTSRTWYYGEDGVKRWADNDQTVTPTQPKEAGRDE